MRKEDFLEYKLADSDKIEHWTRSFSSRKFICPRFVGLLEKLIFRVDYREKYY